MVAVRRNVCVRASERVGLLSAVPVRVSVEGIVRDGAGSDRVCVRSETVLEYDLVGGGVMVVVSVRVASSVELLLVHDKDLVHVLFSLNEIVVVSSCVLVVVAVATTVLLIDSLSSFVPDGVGGGVTVTEPVAVSEAVSDLRIVNVSVRLGECTCASVIVSVPVEAVIVFVRDSSDEAVKVVDGVTVGGGVRVVVDVRVITFVGDLDDECFVFVFDCDIVHASREEDGELDELSDKVSVAVCLLVTLGVGGGVKVGERVCLPVSLTVFHGESDIVRLADF